jgi:hypothetical protein
VQQLVRTESTYVKALAGPAAEFKGVIRLQPSTAQLMTSNKPSVFLSHSSKDKFFVRELADRLRKAGIEVWLDEAEIHIGESLTEKIGAAIDQTDYFAVVLSTNSVNSEWVQRELQIALQKEFRERNVKVLPILLESVEIPAFLRDKLYADVSTPEKFKEQFPKLLKAMGIESMPEPKAPEQKAAPRETPAVARLTEAERRLAGFEDIRIIDLDESRTHNPNPEKLLFHMYLRLSARPPVEWREIFTAERRFPRHTMWRHAWIEDEYVVVHCVPDELGRYHLDDLKQDVQRANEKFREYLTGEAQREARSAQRQRSEQDEIRDLRNRLKFD